MKDKVKAIGKALGKAVIQLACWFCIGALIGTGVAYGFWMTSITLAR